MEVIQWYRIGTYLEVGKNGYFLMVGYGLLKKQENKSLKNNGYKENMTKPNVRHGAKVVSIPRGNYLIWMEWQKGYPVKEFIGLGRYQKTI